MNKCTNNNVGNINDENEERYRITPKGIALISMLNCGLIQDIDDPRFEGFWRFFSEDMERCGYISNEDDME